MRLPETAYPLPRQELKYLLWLPLYLLTFFFLEQRTGQWQPMQLPLDAMIPFCEWFVVPYVLWYPLLAAIGIYLLLKEPASFRRYMAYLSATFFLSALIWLVFPSSQDLRPIVLPRNNLFTALVGVLYHIDTNTNVFPSVHVAGAIGASLAAWDSTFLRKQRILCGMIVSLSILICLSTVFIKQHTLLDVIGGLVLSILVAIPVYFNRHKSNSL